MTNATPPSTAANGQGAVPPSTNGGTLGTFAGVFTPSLLTILGIILFLRLGFVVGNAGLTGALMIIGIATAISVLTSISLAAIATNIEVKGGGDYYLISRTLGSGFGGAIGIVLFLAQSVSIGFYAIGFGEALSSIVGFESAAAPQVVAALAVLALFGLAWAGADVASKFQSVIFVLLMLALISFYAGAFTDASAERLADNMTAQTGSLGFWAVFAIFFPAVTGFTQGVSMSGDLKDAGKSLPTGTFSAVGISTVVYITVAFLLASNLHGTDLITDTGAMGRVAKVGWLIDVGVVAATLSSSMASFLGAPRILQSLASDRVFGFLDSFAKGVGESNNPRRAVLLSFGIALGTIAAGDLNAIAPIVSMFFLISYGLLNYATYYEARAASPSFRPRFKFFSKYASLAGALSCVGAMLAISPAAGAVAIAVLVGIRSYLSKKTADRWVDASHSHHFQRAKESLRALPSEGQHGRNWRPTVLTFSADPARRARLLQFAAWMEGGSGLAAAFSIISGTGVRARREAAAEQVELETQIAQLGLDVHPRAVVAANGIKDLPLIVQSFGIGQVRANTVLFGWQETPGEDRRAHYVAALRDITRLGVNAVTVSTDALRWGGWERTQAKKRRIDIWWTDDDASRLALLVAYLCTRTEDWSRATIRVVAPAEPHEAAATTVLLKAMLERVRIDAEVTTLPSTDQATLLEAVKDASMVFAPIRLGRGQLLDKWDREVDDLLSKLPLTAGFVSAAPVDLEAGPDSGRPGSIVAAEDAVARALTRLNDAEAKVADLRKLLNTMMAQGADGGIEEVEARAAEYEDAKRRRAKARAKHDDAVNELDEVRRGAKPHGTSAL